MLIATALFLIVFGGFFALAQLGVRTVSENKARAGAFAVVRTRMEYVRSISYGAVGIQGGNPAGVLATTTTETLNGTTYTLTTEVTWRDDPEDGISLADADPHDYKMVKVEAAWLEGGRTDSLALSSFVADFIQE